MINIVTQTNEIQFYLWCQNHFIYFYSYFPLFPLHLFHIVCANRRSVHSFEYLCTNVIDFFYVWVNNLHGGRELISYACSNAAWILFALYYVQFLFRVYLYTFACALKSGARTFDTKKIDPLVGFS